MFLACCFLESTDHIMDQDQEERQEYNVCSKKHRENNLGFDFENGGYGLRENPKKSWKISGPESEISGKVNLCKFCSKGFNSPRALFGHLRHHSIKKKKNSIESDKEACFKLVSDFPFDSENLGNFRKKRSIRKRYKPELNSLFSGFDSEEIELGMCLLMLPKGIENWVRSDSASESLEINSATFSEKFSQENGRITDEDDRLKLGGKKANYSSCASDSTCMTDDGDEAAPMEVESCPIVPKENSRSDEIHAASDSDSFFTSSKYTAFKCKNCTRSFGSYQALGGHSAIHKKALKFGTRKIESPEKNAEAKIYANCCRGICSEMGKTKQHKCPVCFKVFGSGQALGGHKRAHISKNNVIELMN